MHPCPKPDPEPEPEPNPDTDSDGILDVSDRCPELSGLTEWGGCPAEDVDGDKVQNADDFCQWTPGSPERRGCPKDELPIPPSLRSPIKFSLNSGYLSPQAIEKLERLVRFLNAHPKVLVHLSGHADFRGKAKFNKTLSQRRVWSVYSYLIKHGVSKRRVSRFAHSQYYPIIHGGQEASPSHSRRVTVTFIQMIHKESAP